MIKLRLFSLIMCCSILLGCASKATDPGSPLKKVDNPSFTNNIEPYVVKGKVLDAQGRPLAGVEVFADNTFLYNSNILGISQEDGYYRLELPNESTSYRMGGSLERSFEEQTYLFDVDPIDSSPFAASTGAIRDFVWTQMGGDIELYSFEYSYPYDENAPEFDLIDVELTLTPIGPIIDGSMGEVIKQTGEYNDGIRLKDVPIGRYKMIAHWTPAGREPVPMLLSVRNTDEFAESLETLFKNEFNTFHRIQLELKFPEMTE